MRPGLRCAAVPPPRHLRAAGGARSRAGLRPHRQCLGQQPNTTRILLFLGQDHAIAAEAGAYARWLIPYVPLECHIRFLQAQSIVVPVMASSALTSLTHVLMCWALVHKAGMGSKGAALSSAISYCINLAILSLYTRLSAACKRTWTGFSMEAFKELRQFAELAFPSAMMVWSDKSNLQLFLLGITCV